MPTNPKRSLVDMIRAAETRRIYEELPDPPRPNSVMGYGGARPLFGKDLPLEQPNTPWTDWGGETRLRKWGEKPLTAPVNDSFQGLLERKITKAYNDSNPHFADWIDSSVQGPPRKLAGEGSDVELELERLAATSGRSSKYYGKK